MTVFSHQFFRLVHNTYHYYFSLLGYHPALRGGVPVFPPQPPMNQPQNPSPSIKRKATPTRPMSFIRALEMTDALEMTPTSSNSLMPTDQQQSSLKNGGILNSNSNNSSNNLQRSTTPTPSDRASVYDMNYEISV